MNTEQNLKNIKAFNEKSLSLGIPSKLLGGSIGFSLIIMVMMNFLLGFILLLVLIVPLYIIHKDDPDASTLYLGEFMSPDKYSFNDIEQAYPIVIINEDGSSTDYYKYINDEH